MLNRLNRIHIPTKWGVLFLAVMMVGLLLLLSQLQNSQDVRSRAMLYEGRSEETQSSTLQENQILGPAPAEPVPSPDDAVIKITLKADGQHTGKLKKLVKNIDYDITVFSTDKNKSNPVTRVEIAGTLPRPRSRSGDWEIFSQSFNFSYSYFYKQRRTSEVSIVVWSRDNQTVVITASEHNWGDKGCKKLGKKYPPNGSISTNCQYTVRSCANGYLSGYCRGGSNYACCVSNIDAKSSACVKNGGKCEVKRSDIYYDSRFSCPGPSSGIGCLMPGKPGSCTIKLGSGLGSGRCSYDFKEPYGILDDECTDGFLYDDHANDGRFCGGGTARCCVTQLSREVIDTKKCIDMGGKCEITEIKTSHESGTGGEYVRNVCKSDSRGRVQCWWPYSNINSATYRNKFLDTKPSCTANKINSGIDSGRCLDKNNSAMVDLCVNKLGGEFREFDELNSSTFPCKGGDEIQCCVYK